MLTVWGRCVASAMAVCGVAFVSGAALSDDLDSEHLFGFTQGTDIGAKGDKELELEGFGGFGRGHCSSSRRR